MTGCALLCDISSCGDVQIDTNLVVGAFSARQREDEWGTCAGEDLLPIVMLVLLVSELN